MNSILVPLVRADTARPGVFAREPLVHKMNFSNRFPVKVYERRRLAYHEKGVQRGDIESSSATDSRYC